MKYAFVIEMTYVPAGADVNQEAHYLVDASLASDAEGVFARSQWKTPTLKGLPTVTLQGKPVEKGDKTITARLFLSTTLPR